MSDYIREAASDQGFDPVIAALVAAGVAHAVENTGGMVINVMVYTSCGRWAITVPDENENGDWYSARFVPGSWNVEEYADGDYYFIDSQDPAVIAAAVQEARP